MISQDEVTSALAHVRILEKMLRLPLDKFPPDEILENQLLIVSERLSLSLQRKSK